MKATQSRLSAVVMAAILGWSSGASAAERVAQGEAPAPAPVAPVEPAPVAPPTVTPPATTEAAPAVTPSPTAPTPATVAPPAPSKPFPVHMTLMHSQSVGEGTFAVNPYARNPLYAWWFSVRPKFDLPYGFALALRQDIDLELTPSELTTYQRQVILSDPRIGLRYEGVKIPLLGLSMLFYSGVRMPISLESRYRRQLGTADLSGSVNFAKWGFEASAGLAFSANARLPGKPVHDSSPLAKWWGSDEEAQAYTDRSGRVITPNKCIARASDISAGGCPSVGALNGTLGAAIGSFSIGYDLGALTPVPVSFSLGLLMWHSLSDYYGPQDEFTSQYAREGFARRDFTWGTFSINVQPFDWLGLSVGTSSLQPLMNRTNQYIRFPWWNIPYWELRSPDTAKNINNYTGAANYSSFQGSVTLTF
ncbi:MAG: hypothetical protein AB2A00_43570 [Myxococcota bacterium]